MPDAGWLTPAQPVPVSQAERVLRAALPGFRRFWALALTVPLAWAGYAGWARVTENFGIVERGVLYRSAQLDGSALARVVSEHGIRSVLMLRGGGPGDAWWEDEQRAVQRLGLRHHQIRLSARRAVNPTQLDDILRVIDQAQKPVLVHCNGGADRTGLVAAAWLLRRGFAPEQARRQLSLRYGYFPYLPNSPRAMQQSLDRYHLALAQQRLSWSVEQAEARAVSAAPNEKTGL